MINGYEYLYKEEIGNKPKYQLHKASDNHFVHNIDGSGKQCHLGVTTCEAYTNLMEQNLGKEVYEELLSLYSNYEDLYTLVKTYQEHKIEFDNLSVKLDKAKNLLKDIESRKSKIQASINGVMRSKDTHKADSLKVLAEELDEIETELDFAKDEMVRVQSEHDNIESIVNSEYTQIKELKDFIKTKLDNLDDTKLAEFKNKFNDRNFQMQIEQEFVDTILLPGEHSKEGGVRFMAQSYFTAFKNEAKYLSSIKTIAQDLLKDINNQYSDKTKKDIFIDDKVSAEYQISKGMKNLSTDIIENSKGRFDSKNVCQFYMDTMQMVKDSKYCSEPTTELYNLPELALSEYKFKTGKAKRLDQDLDCLTEIFDGVSKLIEGKVVLISETKVQTEL